jgi:hypothetical protein
MGEGGYLTWQVMHRIVSTNADDLKGVIAANGKLTTQRRPSRTLRFESP